MQPAVRNKTQYLSTLTKATLIEKAYISVGTLVFYAIQCKCNAYSPYIHNCVSDSFENVILKGYHT